MHWLRFITIVVIGLLQTRSGRSIRHPAPAPYDVSTFTGRMDLPEGVQRFILFTTQRAGTGWTMHKFQSRAPFVRARANEPMAGLMHSKTKNELKKIEWVEYETYLNKTFERRCGKQGWSRGEVACGFKFMYNQLPSHFPYRLLLEYCSRHDIAIIHLVRGNVIRHLISRANHQLDMATLGSMQDPHPRTVAPPRKVDLIVYDSNISTLLKQVADARAALLTYVPHLTMEVQYEALTQSDRQCRAMFAFLHPQLGALPCTDADGDNAIKKQHAGHQCRYWVNNWTHVAETISEFKRKHPMYENTAVYFEKDCHRND